MGVKVEDFLYDYFSADQLKDALYDIGLPAGKTKKERVDKILEKWITYNRGWYDLLNFLDTEDLENICEHFKIEYTNWDDEEELMDKIEENWVLDFRNKPFSKPKGSIQVPKIPHYAFYVVVIWVGIGLILAFLNFSGVFLETHPDKIDISKKYQVAYESWTDENTLTGIFEGMSLTGKIILESTQFSANNKIDVKIELSPNTGSAIEDKILLDSIVPPFYVYFIGTQHYEVENKYDLADILLERSLGGTKLIGEGSLIYSKGGTYEIYLLDSSELLLKQELLTIHDPNGSVVLFPVQENTLNPNGYFDENGNKMKVPTRVEFFSENEPYIIEIKQSDALNSLSSDKMAAANTWIVLAFIPLTIISVLKYFPITKISKYF